MRETTFYKKKKDVPKDVMRVCDNPQLVFTAERTLYPTIITTPSHPLSEVVIVIVGKKSKPTEKHLTQQIIKLHLLKY